MHFPLTRTIRVLAGSLDSLAFTTKRGAAAAAKAVPPSKGRSRKSRGCSIFEPLEDRRLMSTTYYVSPTGNDSNKGTSQSAPWKSITKVDSSHFAAGDSILFQGGKTFSGTLQFRSDDGNSTSNALKVGSYGGGRATINSGKGDGAYAYDTSGVWFDSLIFTGTPNGTNQDGIRLEASGAGRSNFRINNCSISGYGYAGILLAGDHSSGISNIQITNNTVYNNADSGIAAYSGARNVHKNVYIAYNNVYGNYGISGATVSGNGMMLAGLNGATLEHNLSHDNGTKGNGGCGMWTYDSTGVVMQYNMSYDNHAIKGHDGDGFDFDLNTQNSVMQYNYAYGNDGAGFMFDQWQSNSNFTNNVIRYNVSQNNALKNNYAGISIFGGAINCSIYGNVIFVKPSSGNSAGISEKFSALGGGSVKNVHFANNIIVTSGGRPLLAIPSNEVGGTKFTGNQYWSSGSSSYFTFGATYYSMASWQSATGQEKLNGQSVGKQSNPNLSALTGSAMSLTSALALLKACPTAGGAVASPASGIGATNTGGVTVVTPAPAPTPAPTPTPVTPAPTGGDTSTSGWTGKDVGSVGKAGSNSVSGSTYTLTGSGSDIFNNADAFHYDYKTLNGDGQIVAKIDSLSSADVWSKVGVMIRENNSAGSKEVSLFVTPANIAMLQERSSTSQGSASTKVSAAAPEWVKLVRSGNTFTGYISKDGSSWTKVSSTTVSMASTAEIGLAVTSHNNKLLETARFDNVSVIS